MPQSEASYYRNYVIESRASFDGSQYIATFSILREQDNGFGRITRGCDGTFTTEEDAHATAITVARKLIDLMTEDAMQAGG
jgi:hypothetical protein